MSPAPDAPILPGAVLGVLGGGQLGRMFAMAAQPLGYKVHVYTPETDSPASQVAEFTTVAEFTDEAALRQFAQNVAAVTVEFENVPVSALELLAEFVPVRPGANVLAVAQNRLQEKNFFRSLNLPVTPFHPVLSLTDLETALADIGAPAVLKTAGWGYDGKGQVKINHIDEAALAFETLAGQPGILEAWVPFDRELSVIGARSVSGEFSAYGPVENAHKNHILDTTQAPADILPEHANRMREMVQTVMEALEMTGLLCVEFFMTETGEILLNEMAPRPHNSGHYTIEACVTSQFEQQVRTLAGMPLGSVEQLQPAVMMNLLGDLWFEDAKNYQAPHWEAVLKTPGVHLHLYGKATARPGRKMGHLTLLVPSTDEALKTLNNIRRLLGLSVVSG